MRDIAEVLSAYAVEEATTAALPAEVVEKAEAHILDTIAAAVSGSSMKPGKLGRVYVAAQGGAAESLVWTSEITTSMPLAALANAMAAHADETDDSHTPSLTHPGCSIVPTAVAVAEARGRSGMDLLRAVVLGYDICTRVTRALWPDFFDTRNDRVHSTHAIGGAFGSAAAAGLLLGFDAQRCRWLWSYVAQEASGIRTYFNDPHHVEKAFAFAGLPALNGATAATLVDSGWPGGDDPFTGRHNFFGLVAEPDPSMLIDELGTRYEILRARLKKFSTGSPVQAPLEAMLSIMREEDLKSDDIQHVKAWLSPARLKVVWDRPIPDVNVEYLLEAALHDGTLTFKAAHDAERFGQWRSGSKDGRLEVLSDEELGTSLGARVEVSTTSGQVFTRTVMGLPGSPDNPMSRSEIEAKATDLLEPELGAPRTRQVIAATRDLVHLPDVKPIVTALRVHRSDQP